MVLRWNPMKLILAEVIYGRRLVLYRHAEYRRRYIAPLSSVPSVQLQTGHSLKGPSWRRPAGLGRILGLSGRVFLWAGRVLGETVSIEH